MFYDLLLSGSHGGEPCAGAGWKVRAELGARRFFKVFSRRLKDGDIRTAEGGDGGSSSSRKEGRSA